jgi:hypothetical protein
MWNIFGMDEIDKETRAAFVTENLRRDEIQLA